MVAYQRMTEKHNFGNIDTLRWYIKRLNQFINQPFISDKNQSMDELINQMINELISVVLVC